MGMELAKEVCSKLGKGKTRINQFWGTTETAGSMTGNLWDVVDDTFSVGPIFPNLRLRLLDENDQDVAEGKSPTRKSLPDVRLSRLLTSVLICP